MVKNMSRPKKYTIEFLNSLLLNYKAELIGEYSNDSINRETRIQFKCSCGEIGEKSFRMLEKTDSYCKKCAKINIKSHILKNKKYNIEFLNKVIAEYNVELIGEYNNETINCNTYIKFKCKCEQIGEKLFKYINNGGCYCKDCTRKNKIEKIKDTNREKYGVDYALKSDKIREKIKETCKQRYGFENPFQSEQVKEKIKITNIEKFGFENQSQSSIIKNKIKKTNRERYGFENALQSSEIREKIKKTNRERYGFENPFQSSEIKEKIKKTNRKKYGVEYPSQSSEIKEKIKKTNRKNFGVEYTFQSSEIKEKIKKTNKEKYGVEYPSQSGEIKEKKKGTSIEKYGVEYPMHNPEICEKISNNSYKSKTYKLPSGLEIKVQGYEPWTIDELLKIYAEKDLIIGDRTKVPEIWWLDSQGKRHRYYVDIYIPKENRMIEVKSLWTYRRLNVREKIEKVPLACISQGYKYEYWIYDSKGNKTVISEFSNNQPEPILDLKDTLQEQIVNQI